MMMSDKLTLPGYSIYHVERNKKVQLHVVAEDRPRTCIYCGGESLLSKGLYQRKVRHLDYFDKHSELIIKCRRYWCKRCDASFVQPLNGIMPWRRSTEKWREQMYLRHHDGVCASSLARREGFGQATVGRIYSQFTERKARERLSTLCPQVLGIDEHTLHKGQRFATTFCDLKNHKVFDVSQGKSDYELKPYLERLQGRERVKVVCIDLSSAYRSLVRKWFPNAVVVADRFHAIRIVGIHLMRLARDLCTELGWNRSWLGLLRAKYENLSSQKKLELQKLLKAHPVLEPIYELKEKLCNLLRYKHQSKESCRHHVRELFKYIKQLKDSGLAPAMTLAKTLTEWSEEIGRMWRFTRNNGITEGFHRKMKLIQRRAYGFRSFNNYRLRVIAQCG